MTSNQENFSKGKFVISLDFELFWGVRDKRTIESYGNNILGVWKAMPAMLKLFREYNINVTFSTVGFLFAENRDELHKYVPASKPAYTETKLSPYEDVAKLANDANEDPYRFGFPLLQQIMSEANHEIGTHTFCHYYCLEPGQTLDNFREDIDAAKRIAASRDINVQSLVFPRNQFNEEYLIVCKELGITSYRGNPHSWLYKPKNKNDESLIRRAGRIMDAYINLTGHHCYRKSDTRGSIITNIPASRFLRPYSRKLAMLDWLRMRRIKKAMLHAAKNNKLFHLWWHPHNFGANIEENINFLREILQYFSFLQTKYQIESITMTGLTDEISRSHE